MKKKVENLDNNIKGKKISETIERLSKKASKVFIVGHYRPDFDSIGAAVGVMSMCKQLGVEAYIVVPDDYDVIAPDVKQIVYDLDSKFNIIDMYHYSLLKDKNSLLIMVDVNKENRIAFKDRLNDFKDIVIIDHHDVKEGETVDDACRLIFPSSSSACELIAQAMLYKDEKESKSKYKISKYIATLLYSGIELDTERFKSRTTNITHAVANKLLEYGADKEYINDLFRNDRATYNTIANLIVNGTVLKQYSKDFKELGISFNLNKETPDFLYTQEELAKAADLQIEFKDTDAAFALGYIQKELVAISARSSSDSIDVGKIMESLNGGGSAHSAGTQIYTNDIEGVEEQLIQIVEDFLSLQETPVVNLEPDLTAVSQPFKRYRRRKRNRQT